MPTQIMGQAAEPRPRPTGQGAGHGGQGQVCDHSGVTDRERRGGGEGGRGISRYWGAGQGWILNRARDLILGRRCTQH